MILGNLGILVHFRHFPVYLDYEFKLIVKTRLRLTIYWSIAIEIPNLNLQ